MPDLPLYGNQKVRTAALPQVAYDPGEDRDRSDEIVAGAVNRAVQNVGQTAASIAHGVDQAVERQKEEADAAAVFKAEADFERSRNGIVRDYVTNRRGEDAVPGSLDATAGVNAAYKSAASSLKTDRQRDVFARRTLGTLVGTENTIENHAAREVETVKTSRYEALRDAKLQTIATFASDPAANPSTYVEAAQSALEVIRAEGSRRGAPAEATDREVAKFRRDAAKVVLDSYLANGRDAEAATFFEAAKDEMGPDAAKYAAAISRAGLVTKAQSNADAIKTAAFEPGSQWLNAEKARLDVDAIKDPEERKATLAMVEQSIAVNDQERRQAASKQAAIAKAAFSQRGLLEDIPAQTWQYLNDPQNGEEAIDEALRLKEAAQKVVTKQRRAGSGLGRREQIEADRLARQLYLEAAEDDLDEATKADVNADPRFVDASPLAKSWIRTKQAAGKKVIDGGGFAKLTEARKTLDDAMAPLKLKKADKALATAALDDWFAEYVDSHKGQAPTNAEARAKMGEFLTVYDSDGGRRNLIMGRPKRGYAVKAEDEYRPLDPDLQDSPLAKQYLEQQNAKPSAPAAKPAPSGYSPDDIDLARQIKAEMPTATNAERMAEFEARKKGAATFKVKTTKKEMAPDVAFADEEVAAVEVAAPPGENPIAKSIEALKQTRKPKRR